MNRRNAILVTLALCVGSAAPALQAQAPGATPRIGFLTPSYSKLYKQRLEVFKKGLRELGYVERRNFVIELRSADGKYERLPALAAELVRLKVDVIVAAGGTPSTLAARNATRTIPIVFPTIGDPVSRGIVASLARPGGNVTGLSQQGEVVVGKRMQLLKEMVPTAKRFAILSNPDNASSRQFTNEGRVASGSLGVELLVIEARSPAEFDDAFAEIDSRKIDGLVIFEDAMLSDNFAQLVGRAAKRKLPTMGGNSVVPEAGGLASYGPNRLAMYERAAAYVDKILKGAKPADLPVELTSKFDLVINMKAAKALGLTIPPSVRERADRVIE